MKFVFSVENSHSEQCGDPPSWTSASREGGELRAYFENVYGEQWIASAKPDLFLLTSGDIGWRTVRIDAPDYRSLVTRCADTDVSDFGGTILNREERLWLLAVLTVAHERMSI